MPKQISVAQARQLAENIKAGEYDDDEKKKQLAIHLVAQTVQRKNAPVIDNAQLTKQEQRLAEGKFSFPEAVRSTVRAGVGAGETALTVGSAAIATPVAGAIGLGSFATDFVGLTDVGDIDARADLINGLIDAYTITPRTEEGKALLQTVAAPLITIDNFARDTSAFLGQDNAMASTLIYTTIMGAADVIGLKGGRALKASGTLAKEANRLEALARDLGLNTKPSRLAESIIESAKDMTPAIRAENAEALGQALQQARNLAKSTADDFAVRAANTKAYVDVKESAAFAQNYAKEALAKGVDINEMPHINRALDDLANLETRSPSTLSADIVKPEPRIIAQTNKVTVSRNIQSPAKVTGRRIQDIQLISNRLEKAIARRSGKRLTPDTMDEVTQMINLQKELDGWLDYQFNSDMIKGDPRAVRRWKDATEARTAYNKRFNADKTLVQLMNRAAKPDELHRFLFGASAAGAKPQAVAAVRRLKEVLGKNHPSMTGIRQDFLYELAQPLFGESPDLKMFVRNFDKTMRNNANLVRELGIQSGPMTQLRNFAQHAIRLNLHNKPGFFNDLATSVAQFMFGNELSKRSLLVRKATFPIRAIGRVLFGPKHGQAKELISNIAGANVKAPVIDKFSNAAGNLLIGAALAQIHNRARVFLQEDDDLERKMKELQEQL